MPFTVVLVVFLNIPCLKLDFAFGEKTFHLGAITSAIGNKYHNTLTRGVDQLGTARLNRLCLIQAEDGYDQQKHQSS